MTHHPPHINHLTLEQGDARDYAALCRHHYRAGRPGSFMRVWALRDRQPTAADRFAHRCDMDRKSRTVGVLVESIPTLECRLRDYATADRYGAWPAAQRAALLRDEVRCISRVIIHPQWRGLGLAVRLVRHALATSTTIFTEALAAMGQVHPFLEKAGMTAYVRPPHEADARLMDALAHIAPGLPGESATFSMNPSQLATLPPATRAWFDRELIRWQQQMVRGRRVSDTSEILAIARRQLLFRPVYYLHDNRTKDAINHDASWGDMAFKENVYKNLETSRERK